ncbi:MAG: non-homologous end-joining DNA ligase [Syntrophales bacterium]
MRKVAEVAGEKLTLTNLDKDLYPSYGFTKAHILEYYRRISPFILPHLAGRALTLKRYPNGVAEAYFFEKRCPSHRPAWVKTAEVRRDRGEPMTVCLVDDLPTLIWVENLASLELHVPLARAASPETPDSLVFDLDPGTGAGILACARVALILRELLLPLRLVGYVKTSGQKGLHVYVPLNRTSATFADTKRFAKAVAELLQRTEPDLVTARMAKEQRRGKVFINWSQNDAAKTMVCVYSLRAREKPYVSFPLTWEELENLSRQGDPERLQVLHAAAVSRAEQEGDLFREVLVRKQKLPTALGDGRVVRHGGGLAAYEAKRSFAKTPEPKPQVRRGGKDLVFVVQKHAARALHYDLRLEMEGVLKSWAVPRGPSLDPSVKRLAVLVEDHPLDYREFEGIIPDHNYGAGSVIIWDRGVYRHPAARDRKESERLLREGLHKGDLKFLLEGEKLRGEFALVKTRSSEKSWLLLKKKDPYATAGDILRENRSVVSGRTLEDVSADNPQPSSRRRKLDQVRLRETLETEELRLAPVQPMPQGLRPMLATLVKEPFDHPDWIFEMKWDGYRAIAAVRDGEVSLTSRNGIPLGRDYPPLVESLRKFKFAALLDGEIVVADDRGHPDFQMLQDYRKSGKGHLLYYVFDLLHLAGHDLTNLPLIRRKELLKKILPAVPNIKFSDHVATEGTLFFRVVKEKGLEGIVAKHSPSPYRPGRRSRQWLKVKTHLTQEGVIAGFTEPRGQRRHIGALVLGVYAGEELVYIGHTGGGFGAAKLAELHEKLRPLIRKRCPFRREPETNTPVTWVKPELVCEVQFSGWTAEGMMRQPVFLRLRSDKSPREVVAETPRPGGAPAGGGGAKE